jgi:hypothetical protein
MGIVLKYEVNIARLSGLALALYLTAAVAEAAPCIDAKDSCAEWISMGSGPARVMAYRTFSLHTRSEAITRALIVIHGAPRNAPSGNSG